VPRKGRRLWHMPSTVIRSIRYRPDERELEVLFTTGRCYLFHDVPAAAAEAFSGARIKGRHFNRHIRNHYRFTSCEAAAGLV
jgi:hypothetical protein